MAEQPQDFIGLVRSVMETARHPSTTGVISTIASREVSDLSTHGRSILTNYNEQMQAQAMALDAAAPGVTVTVRQTDQWYLTHDRNGSFRRLFGLVETVGRSNR